MKLAVASGKTTLDNFLNINWMKKGHKIRGLEKG